MTETAINNTGATALTPTAKPSLWKAAVMSGVVAAAATSTTAAIARAGDVTLAVKGEQIPISGFAVFTVVGAVLGLVLAAALSRRATRPRRTFLLTTAVLTVLSLVPDAFADTTTASKLVLVLTHLIAAAIIVPSLAARLGPDIIVACLRDEFREWSTSAHQPRDTGANMKSTYVWMYGRPSQPRDRPASSDAVRVAASPPCVSRCLRS